MKARELRVTYARSGEPPRADQRTTILGGKDAAAILIPILAHEPQEVFGVLLLNARHKLIGWQEVHRGSVDTVQISPCDVFRAAIMLNSPAIIVAHNHPSGDPAPSPDDHDVTRRLRAAGDLLGIEVLDHVIIGDGIYTSYKESGRW